MKNYLILLSIIALFSCKKEVAIQTVQSYQLTATVRLKTTEQTVLFDFFVANSKTTPINEWLFVKRLYKKEVISNPQSFGFNAPAVCYVSIDAVKPVYGMIREQILNAKNENEYLPYDFDNIIIHN